MLSEQDYEDSTILFQAHESKIMKTLAQHHLEAVLVDPCAIYPARKLQSGIKWQSGMTE